MQVYRGSWRHTDVAVKRLLDQDVQENVVQVSVPQSLLRPLCMRWCLRAEVRHALNARAVAFGIAVVRDWPKSSRAGCVRVLESCRHAGCRRKSRHGP